MFHAVSVTLASFNLSNFVQVGSDVWDFSPKTKKIDLQKIIKNW